MFDDYAACVMQDYRQKVLLTDLSLKLKHPTAAKLREACIEVCDSRFKLKDEKVLADLFKTQANRDAYLQAIEKSDADQYRPLLNYIKGRTTKPDERNIELLAWLIDFEPRPYRRDHPYILVKTPSTPGKPPRTDFIKDKNKISRIAQLVIVLIMVIGGGILWWFRAVTPNDGKCMYWAQDHYERGNCAVKPADENALVVAFDTVRWQTFKKITTPDTLNASSIGKVWYIKLHGAIEYYTAPGLHPLYPDRRLLPLTAHILDTYNRTESRK